jgi:signal transduction histidine kinase
VSPLFLDRPIACARRVFTTIVLVVGGASTIPAQPAENTHTITNAAEVLALPIEAASKNLQVTIRGVVTAAEPNWQGQFVVQDETAGIFVQNVGAQPKIGDWVEVTGTSGPGLFAPVLQSTGWKKLGTAPLPPPKRVAIDRLMAGVETSQRVEVTGLVRAITTDPSQKTMMEIAIGGYRVRIFPRVIDHLDLNSLVASRVRICGTVTTAFNTASRQLTAVNIMVPSAEDFVVLEPERHSPFEQPFIPLRDVARYRPNATLGERIRIKGTLTFQRQGLDLFIQDETGGLHVKTHSALALPLGTVVEAAGFLEFVDYQPVLTAAVFKPLAEPAHAITGSPVSLNELREGLHGAELITLQGVLLDRSVRPILRDNSSFAGYRTVCTIRKDDQSLIAEYEGAQENTRFTSIPIGSLVEITGVAYFETGESGKPRSIRLLVPEADDIKVLKTPSWFTAGRLFIGLSIVTFLLCGTGFWLITIARKNAMLGVLINEREQAQKELQEAHDQLEERVKERTEQLKLEMTVRKSAEVEFRAVLAERTRLARELHDTLEQALTGIALQLDTASKLFQRNPEEAGKPMELARGFLHQSQIELRRSIWDLRSRELEQFDLAEALSIASRQLAEGSGISMELETLGERKRLSEIVEENLLRISQEALTNVVKHAGATSVAIRLTYSADSVSLEIKDNGCGLNEKKMSGQDGRHFGLLGMSERAKRLDGRLDVSGAPGQGTTVRVIIPLDEAHAAHSAIHTPASTLS